MQTTLYLIRHGEVNNPDKIIYGRLPSFHLTNKGKHEIEQTATFLEDKSISAIFSSPLLRTRQSARIIQNKLHLPKIHTSKLITEVNTSYEGKKSAELDEIQSEIYLKPLRSSDETLTQLANRMQKFVNSILTRYSGKRIIILSHGDPLMVLFAVIKKLPLRIHEIKKINEYIQHGEVYKLSIDNDQLMTLTQVFKPDVSK